jgi:hypothetical protein
MKLSLTLAVAATLLPALAAPALAAPATAPHAAACVAALKGKEAGLAAALKAGGSVEPELYTVVRSGIAIIGAQMLAGLREDEGKRLLKAAEREFQALPRSAADARQAQCLQEGQAIYQNASAIEKGLIASAAQRRVRKLTAA